MCMDCHVLLAPGSLGRLIDYYDQNPDCKDLLCGPLVMDDLTSTSTHFDDVWRGEMWGIWAHAWTCGCGKTHFVTRDQEGQVELLDLLAPEKPPQPCGTAGCVMESGWKPAKPIAWPKHEEVLGGLGFRLLGHEPDDPPFEIPAQGLGLFTCRKDAWLGFNEHFRGFGGEEWYIHDKFRQAGHHVTCLPSLRWVHRFGRPGGTKYSLSLWNKVRNYVIGHNELGLPLDRLKGHFVKPKRMSEEQWEHLIADPIGHEAAPVSHAGGCGSCKEDLKDASLQDIYEYYAKQEGDFSSHFPMIAALAQNCDHVTDLGNRDYDLAALAGGQPKRIVSYNMAQQSAIYWRLEGLAKKNKDFSVLIRHNDSLECNIEETDLLFIKTYHTAERLGAELARHAHKVRRYIVVVATEIYGRRAADGTPGLKTALIDFMHKNPEWSVVYNSPKQYGMMVLSKNPDDKPKRPGVVTLAKNYLKHTAEYVADGMEDVSPEQFRERLETCTLCTLRADNDSCSLCGCPPAPKAKRRASYCDANLWLEIDARYADKGK
ncbi:MAG: hypothetical protein ACYSVY_15690 [Planctomycetota bacterium]